MSKKGRQRQMPLPSIIISSEMTIFRYYFRSHFFLSAHRFNSKVTKYGKYESRVEANFRCFFRLPCANTMKRRWLIAFLQDFG